MSAPVYELTPSPLGPLLLVGDKLGLRRLHMQDGPCRVAINRHWQPAEGELDQASAQLGEYFAGERVVFDLALAPHGTPWQRLVWRALGEIPHGETLSYGRLAERLGHPRAARAVGAANGSNPISIVIPCHRLIGGDGALTGYAGGIERKRRLLALEAVRRDRRAPVPSWTVKSEPRGNVVGCTYERREQQLHDQEFD